VYTNWKAGTSTNWLKLQYSRGKLEPSGQSWTIPGPGLKNIKERQDKIMGDKDDNLVKDIFDSDDQAGEETDNKIQTPEEEGESEDIEKPEKKWAGKFNTAEDLEEGYRNLETWQTRNAQENARIRAELEQLRQAVIPDMTTKQQQEWWQYVQKSINTAVVDENPEPLMQLIGQMVEYSTEQKLRERDQALAPIYEQQRFQTEVNDFLLNNPEAGEYLDDMQKLIQSEPDIVRNPDWLYQAYGKVLNRKIKGGAALKAKTEAAKEAAGMPGSGPRGSQETLTDDEKIKKALFGDTGKRRMFDY